VFKDLNQSISFRNDFATAYFERGKISQSRASYVVPIRFEKSKKQVSIHRFNLRKADIHWS
jgi:hypothetical protein